MTTAALKECRINIRCDSPTHDLLSRAAAYEHVSVSEFVLAHAVAAAEQVVRAHESISLQPTDFQAFVTALDTPTKANAALQKTFQSHADSMLK